MTRKSWLYALAAVAALLIAFLLRDVVEQLIIRPLIFLAWWLGYLYRFLPQPVIWLLLVLFLIYLAVGRIAGQIELPEERPGKPRRVQGPVDELASQIERRHEGIYFKWQIARMLGQIALDLQELRLHIRSRRLEQGSSSPQVYNFLDSGLNSSFADYPLPGSLPLTFSLFQKSKPEPGRTTPFDGDINPVIDYLEAEMEKYDDRRRS